MKYVVFADKAGIKTVRPNRKLMLNSVLDEEPLQSNTGEGNTEIRVQTITGEESYRHAFDPQRVRAAAESPSTDEKRKSMTGMFSNSSEEVSQLMN